MAEVGVPNPNLRTVTDITLEVDALPQHKRVNGAYVALLTRDSYLPGVVLLHRSMQRVNSRYPLLVMFTPSLPRASVEVMKALGILTQEIPYLLPREKVSIIAERFADTWTKLRTFEMDQYERVVMIDADMMLLQNMDELFEMNLPNDWIAANHGCVCNLDKQPWAPEDWTQENCPYTNLTHPECLTQPTPIFEHSIRVHKLMNSGLVVLHPSKAVFKEMENYLYTDPKVATFGFPDQDFLAAFFERKWRSISWTYNAVKISRRWHTNHWDDLSTKNLHYICDKPWSKRPNKGDEEEETHGWWWREWDLMWSEWGKEMDETKKTLEKLVDGSKK